MKILHTADWHIGDKKGPSLNGVNLRAQDTLNCLNELVRVAKEENPDIALVSGLCKVEVIRKYCKLEI